ncbi:hypothetical protein MNBD_GAMMA09-3798 [hydrothermal vent metagenome]|uniref:Uncharacterized protein n=1 Tax=hydrothermal vent metagenome TaxID=652676 RepID=A0A3B0XGS6_9ZZZZ
MNREVLLIQKAAPCEDGARIKLKRIFPAGKRDNNESQGRNHTNLGLNTQR